MTNRCSHTAAHTLDDGPLCCWKKLKSAVGPFIKPSDTYYSYITYVTTLWTYRRLGWSKSPIITLICEAKYEIAEGGKVINRQLKGWGQDDPSTVWLDIWLKSLDGSTGAFVSSIRGKGVDVVQIFVWATDWRWISHLPRPSYSRRPGWASAVSLSPLFCCYLTVYGTFPLPPIVKNAQFSPSDRHSRKRTAPLWHSSCLLSLLSMSSLTTFHTQRHTLELLYPFSVHSACCQLSMQILICFIFSLIWLQRSRGSDVFQK